MCSGHQGKATGDQIKSSKTTVSCMPSPPRAGNEGTLSCSTFFRNSISKSAPLQGRCHCWRCQCGSIQIQQKAGVPRFVQFFCCRYVERCNEWSIRDAHLKADFILIILPIIIFVSFAQQVILIVAPWLFSHGGKPPGHRIMRNSGATRMSEHRVTRKDKVRTARTPKVLKSC